MSYFVIVVTESPITAISASIYAMWLPILPKILRSDNWKCHGCVIAVVMIILCMKFKLEIFDANNRRCVHVL